MIEVEITIGGHKFRIACAPGEEEQLDSAAKLLDREALALQSINGRVPETKMLLMAGLMLGDKIKSLEWEKASVKKDLINNKEEIEKLRKQLDGFQDQKALDLNEKVRVIFLMRSEVLNLLKSTADTLDKLVANFTNVKENILQSL